MAGTTQPRGAVITGRLPAVIGPPPIKLYHRVKHGHQIDNLTRRGIFSPPADDHLPSHSLAALLLLRKLRTSPPPLIHARAVRGGVGVARLSTYPSTGKQASKASRALARAVDSRLTHPLIFPLASNLAGVWLRKVSSA